MQIAHILSNIQQISTKFSNQNDFSLSLHYNFTSNEEIRTFGPSQGFRYGS